MADKQYYYEAVGRRKTASARVRLYPATESAQIVVNDTPFAQYFPRLMEQQICLGPLQATETEGRYNVLVLVQGGGINGQAGAVRQGIARALSKADEQMRAKLKAGGYLTRDARAKERKKAGLKRARKAPQYTKR